ncbi:MAG: hypothetical protein KF774_16070, partial [Planctomyces sp.]|nr:hypothetical protein [Planctomyces sp.]
VTRFHVIDTIEMKTIGTWPFASFSLSGDRLFVGTVNENGMPRVEYKDSPMLKESSVLCDGVAAYGLWNVDECITIADSIATLRNVANGEARVLGPAYQLAVSPDRAICFQRSNGSLVVHCFEPEIAAREVEVPGLHRAWGHKILSPTDVAIFK